MAGKFELKAHAGASSSGHTADIATLFTASGFHILFKSTFVCVELKRRIGNIMKHHFNPIFKLTSALLLSISLPMTLGGCGGGGDEALSAGASTDLAAAAAADPSGETGKSIEAIATYSVGGTLSGLKSGTSLVLRNNGVDSLTRSANGVFTFATKLGRVATYAVTVYRQPVGQKCTVTNGSGAISSVDGGGIKRAANVSNVSVACVATYSVGGSVSGLNSGAAVVLRNNGTDNLTRGANGVFTFATKLANAAPYAVTVYTQPVGQTCTVTNASGSIPAANVADVGVACVTSSTSSTSDIGPKAFVATSAAKGTLFAHPSGNGSTCSKTLPCDIWTAVGKAAGADVVFLRGGTYAISRTLTFTNVGSSAAPVIFESYPGESAVFDGSSNPKGTNIAINVKGKFIALRNFEVKNMPMQGFWTTGTDNTFDSLHVHHNGLSGIQVYSPYDSFPYNTYGSRNVIKNCVVHDNFDEGVSTSAGFANGGNADGISISSGADNRVENNLVYHNSDDGIDTWRSTRTYVKYNISHSNGIADGNGNGIKAGGAVPSNGTLIERNLAYSNKAFGVDYNTGAADKFLNNTTWNNRGSFVLGSDTVVSNNIASEASRSGTGIATNNSWQRSGSVVFISTDSASPNFLVPTVGGGFENIGAFAK